MSGIKSFKQSTKYQETHDEVARVGSTQLDKAWKKSGFRVANFSLNTFRWFTISEVSSENCRLAADGSKNNTTIQFLHSPFHLWISKGWFVLFLLRWGSWRIKEAGTPSGTYLPHAALRKSRSQPSLRQDSLHSHTYTEPDHSTSKDWLLSGGELREGSILSLPTSSFCTANCRWSRLLKAHGKFQIWAVSGTTYMISDYSHREKDTGAHISPQQRG